MTYAEQRVLLKMMDSLKAHLDRTSTHVKRAQAIAARPTAGPREQWIEDEIRRADNPAHRFRKAEGA